MPFLFELFFFFRILHHFRLSDWVENLQTYVNSVTMQHYNLRCVVFTLIIQVHTKDFGYITPTRRFLIQIQQYLCRLLMHTSLLPIENNVRRIYICFTDPRKIVILWRMAIVCLKYIFMILKACLFIYWIYFVFFYCLFILKFAFMKILLTLLHFLFEI